MFREMMNRFRDLQEEIRLAVEEDDFELVHPLDLQLIEAWEQILDFSPTSHDETIMMAEFLLDILTKNLDQTKGELAAKAKIIDLVKNNGTSLRNQL